MANYWNDFTAMIQYKTTNCFSEAENKLGMERSGLADAKL